MILRLSLFVLFAAMTVSSQQSPNLVEPGVSHELAIWRAAHYSDVRYKLNLTLEKMSPVLKGTIEIRVKVSEPPASAGGQNGGRASRSIILDWRKIRGSEQLSTVSNVSLNGKSLSVSANWPPADAGGSDFNEHLIFRDGVVAGENVIKLDFTSPILTSGSAITRYIDKEDGAEYIYSLFVPSDASTAFPVFDQPDLKARFTLEIAAPAEWNIVSNGDFRLINNPLSLVKLPEKYLIRRTFEETKPISTYVFAFAAGPWERVSSPSVSAGAPEHPSNAAPSLTVGLRTPETDIYVRKSQAAKFKPHAAEVFRLTREAIKYLETYFDYKFPWPKYDLVLIPEFPFGGMEHAGATFLKESSVIFPQEPTRSDYISRANLIFHETAHQWFGDTVTMKWFDDLWLKEGFAEFMAYKTLEHVMPEANAWKVFYERNKQAAYLTDSTKGTTPIYQKIDNLSAAKSAYGNIVYRKAPSFLRQAEFYLGEDKFQTAVRAFLKKHEFANAGWEDLVKEFETASGKDLKAWAENWVKRPVAPVFRQRKVVLTDAPGLWIDFADNASASPQKVRQFTDERQNTAYSDDIILGNPRKHDFPLPEEFNFVFLNYQDYGYGIFLLDDKSRDYVLKNIQNEKDPFLRSMMWGSLWDSVREAELDPKVYVELVVKNLATEQDESTIQSLLGRVSTAMNYYLSEPPASADRVGSPTVKEGAPQRSNGTAPSLTVGLRTRLEAMLIDRMQNSPTLGLRITFYRAFLNIGSSEKAQKLLNDIYDDKPVIPGLTLKLKDRYDLLIRLAILQNKQAEAKISSKLGRESTSETDEERRYKFALIASIPTTEMKEYLYSRFVSGDTDLSESWIEGALSPYNSIRHADLTLPYLERALKELPNLKRNRKIFFVNGWLVAFIGGQRSEEALNIVNKFLADNPNLDKDLRLKILENVDLIERAVKIRAKYPKP